LDSASPDLAVGVLLPTREAFLRGSHDAGGLLELAERAEADGLDSVWVGDSLLARPRLEALSLLAAVAARTRRLTLGTAVLLAALRHPVLLAQTVATLDRIASGRLILGLGAGFPYPATEAEFVAVGVPFAERIGRLAEAVEICRSLWSDGGPVVFKGRYYQLEGVELEPKPAQVGGPPLWLAGAGDRALARAGQHFDGWLPYSPDPMQFAAGWRAVQAAAAVAGHRPEAMTPALYVTVALDADRDHAQAALEAYVQAYYGMPLQAMSPLQAFYGGTGDGCVDWLGAYIAAGAQHVIVRFATLNSPQQMLREFTGGVLPSLREHVKSQTPRPAA
jgi:probable F420-dependent oxidoreductase